MALSVDGPRSHFEPSRLQERDKHHLPKSYVEAAEEGMDQLSKTEINGISMKATTPMKHDIAQSPAREAQKQGSSPHTNIAKKETDGQRIFTEKTQDNTSEKLASVKPTLRYEEGIRQDANGEPLAKETPDHELVSGRRAGAGWEKSRSAPPPPLSPLLAH